MFDFNFPAWGIQCRICEEAIPLERYRATELCEDCEFDSLTPPVWDELLLAAIERWKQDTAS